MDAAARVIAVQGLGAATATIAREAGVSNGSLFTYFDTKADLLNQLYLELKTDMGAAALGGLPADGDVREQLLSLCSGWLRWATAYPERRRTLAQLDVSDEITETTHQAASRAMKGIAEILERSRENGPLRDAPLAVRGRPGQCGRRGDDRLHYPRPGERRRARPGRVRGHLANDRLSPARGDRATPIAIND